MTVIAWDGKTLAADKQAQSAGLVHRTTKIFRLNDNALVGISGHLPRGLSILKYLQGSGEFPKMEEENQWAKAMVVWRDGTIHIYETYPTPHGVDGPPHAIGSAADFAATAMFLGKTAVEAVEIACTLSADCGLGIDTLTFE